MRREAILDILDRLDPDRILEGKTDIQITCPFAFWKHKNKTDRKPSMGIKIDEFGESLVNCFGCHTKGTLITVLQELNWRHKWTLGDIVKLACEYERDHLFQAADAVVKKKLEPPYVPPEKYYSDSELEAFAKDYHDYAFERGIKRETWKKWELAYDDYFQRLVFPVRDQKHRLFGLVGRGITDDIEPRYFNYWKFEKTNILYGCHLIEGRGPIVVVEGMIDVLKVWQEGIRCLGLLGSDPSKRQLDLLRSYDSPLILMLDNNEAGADGTKELIEGLKSYVQLRYTVYDYDDPGKMTGEEIRQTIEDSKLIL